MRSFADTTVRFTFDPAVPVDEVEGTLELSRLAAGILHGAERVELEVPCRIDRDQRIISIDTSTDPGRTVATIFLGFVRREFGSRNVRIGSTIEAQIAGAP